MTAQNSESSAKPRLDVVVPVYNEGPGVDAFHSNLQAVCQSLDYEVRVIFVDDGSTDDTGDYLAEICSRDDGVTVLELSRNFGHQAALTAGMDYSNGDVVITMDADGQHPPDLIPEMIRLMEAGIDLVLTRRTEEDAIPRHRRWSSGLFYRIVNKLSGTHIEPGAADFRLMTREVVAALSGMREYHRFLRGMVSWIGFRTAFVPYVPKERVFGRSKYSLARQLRLALDALFSFSLAPLYFAIILGVFFILMALVEAVYVAQFWLTGRGDQLAPGWSSLMFVILIVGGTLSILSGIVGLYIGYIFQEVKRRPIYVLKGQRTTARASHANAQTADSQSDAANTQDES